jgi:SAM-dependent methyltransferase
MTEQHDDHHHDHHQDDHQHGPTTEWFTAEFWDERYGSKPAIWSGNPNPRLVEQVSLLAPGRALDVGSGEGADAIWLAQRGWQVTAVDVSTVALQRAAASADGVGADVAGRITWQQADVLTWDPAPDTFDLITAQFMHLPADILAALHLRLAAAVRPGGTLLIVGHHPRDLDTTLRRPGSGALLFTAEAIAERLDPAQWEIVVAEAQAREVKDADGNPATAHDAVLAARRR